MTTARPAQGLSAEKKAQVVQTLGNKFNFWLRQNFPKGGWQGALGTMQGTPEQLTGATEEIKQDYPLWKDSILMKAAQASTLAVAVADLGGYEFAKGAAVLRHGQKLKDLGATLQGTHEELTKAYNAPAHVSSLPRVSGPGPR